MSTSVDDEKVAEKRPHSETVESGDDANDDEWIGPMPSEAVKPKKRKGTYSEVGMAILYIIAHNTHLPT